MVMSKKTLSLPVIAGLFACLGILAFFTLESLLIKLVYSYIQFRNHSLALQWYKDLPIELNNHFYFYNVTNAHEIVTKGAKPSLKEIGPFVYKLYFNKTDVKVNSNDTITFYEKRTWYFEQKESAFNDEIKVTTLNAPLVAAFTLIQTVPNPLRYLLTKLIESISHEIFIERTVKQLMFDGYPDAFASLGPLIDPSLAKNKGKFGYMWPKNASVDSLFTVFAGKDITKFNLINKLDGKQALSTWLTDDCNRINDTTNGEARPSLLPQSPQHIKMYQPLICRPVTMNFTRPAITKDGFQAFNFKVDMNMFRNQSDYPPNACFGSKIVKKIEARKDDDDNGTNDLLSAIFMSLMSQPANKKQTKQFPFGVMDLSKCYFGAPVLMSLPHFLNGDPYYLSTIDGLKPNEALHQFWLDIEPITGITMDAAIRFQVNFFINKPKNIHRFEKVPEIAFPVLWQEILVNWPPNFASKIRILFYLLHSSPYITFGVCSAITCLLLFIFVYKIFNWKEAFNKFGPTKTSQTESNEDMRQIVAENKDVNENKVGIENPALENWAVRENL